MNVTETIIERPYTAKSEVKQIYSASTESWKNEKFLPVFVSEYRKAIKNIAAVFENAIK